MTITLVFLALLMGVDRLVAVPPDGQRRAVDRASAPCEDAHGDGAVAAGCKTALWVFLAVATSLFALFISAYCDAASTDLDWTPMPQPQLLMAEHRDPDRLPASRCNGPRSRRAAAMSNACARDCLRAALLTRRVSWSDRSGLAAAERGGLLR